MKTLRPGFQFPYKTELWKPLVVDAQMRGARGAFFLPAIGRLKSGVTLKEAQTEMDDIARRLERQYPDTNAGCGVNVMSMREQLVRKIRPALLALLGAVACVLLIACASVANLLLARETAGRKEIAIRVALGAGRWRIARQLLTESLILAGLSGVLGLLLANWGMSGLLTLGAHVLPRAEMIGIDARVRGARRE
jgi:putative ABC transport system permease protein